MISQPPPLNTRCNQLCKNKLELENELDCSLWVTCRTLLPYMEHHHPSSFPLEFPQLRIPSNPHAPVRNSKSFLLSWGCVCVSWTVSWNSSIVFPGLFPLFSYIIFDAVSLLICRLCLYLCLFFFFATNPTFFLFPTAVLALNLALVEQNQGEILHETFKIFSSRFLIWRWSYYLRRFPSFLHRWRNLKGGCREVVKNLTAGL